MGKIVQLDEALSNKIAAGEVVDRPASVVKELVENALDANSTIIEIDVEEAGLASIRIIDNGDGILAEDVEKAFQRHATSKIKDETDLFRIRTLGFRGEALPSVASVSRFELMTSTGDGPGKKIVLEGGIIKKLEPASSRKGTDITVADLFFNTPARLKYMKTIHTELGNITDVVNRLALSHPDVSFRLSHNGNRLLYTSGNGDIRQVLAAVYGVKTAKKMIPIRGESLDFIVEGYVSLPEITRASRNYISTMINSRFVKNYHLANAITEGYHTLLPIGRHPIAVFSIEMDPILVDVNVHPAKMEVRLSKEQELMELVANTIKSAFKQQQLIPSGFNPEKKDQGKSEQTSFNLEHVVENGKQILENAKIQNDLNKDTLGWVKELNNTIPNGYQKEVQQDEIRKSYQDDGNAERISYKPQSVDILSPNTIKESQALTNVTAIDEPRIPPMYPIGQMHGTYIFAQNENGLYMIDQHAAQERIKYEFYSEKVGQVENELQEMLVPITLEFSMDEYLRINENKNELEKVGVFLEDFGQHSFIIRAHPQWFPKGIEQQIIEEMIEQLLLMKKVDVKKLREEAAILMSCKASIKANRHLRNDEIQALLDELRYCSDPYTCPHGRPVIVQFSTYDLEKMFKRVM